METESKVITGAQPIDSKQGASKSKEDDNNNTSAADEYCSEDEENESLEDLKADERSWFFSFCAHFIDIRALKLAR